MKYDIDNKKIYIKMNVKIIYQKIDIRNQKKFKIGRNNYIKIKDKNNNRKENDI